MGQPVGASAAPAVPGAGSKMPVGGPRAEKLAAKLHLRHEKTPEMPARPTPTLARRALFLSVAEPSHGFGSVSWAWSGRRESPQKREPRNHQWENRNKGCNQRGQSNVPGKKTVENFFREDGEKAASCDNRICRTPFHVYCFLLPWTKPEMVFAKGDLWVVRKQADYQRERPVVTDASSVDIPRLLRVLAFPGKGPEGPLPSIPRHHSPQTRNDHQAGTKTKIGWSSIGRLKESGSSVRGSVG